MRKTAQSVRNRIHEWEMDAGESFTDYYMHNRVKPVSWAFWLLGKGYVDHANTLINRIQAGEKYISQEDLFHIYMVDGWDEKLYGQDVMLWAEFLSASDRYFNEIVEWFEEN